MRNKWIVLLKTSINRSLNLNKYSLVIIMSLMLMIETEFQNHGLTHLTAEATLSEHSSSFWTSLMHTWKILRRLTWRLTWWRELRETSPRAQDKVYWFTQRPLTLTKGRQSQCYRLKYLRRSTNLKRSKPRLLNSRRNPYWSNWKLWHHSRKCRDSSLVWRTRGRRSKCREVKPRGFTESCRTSSERSDYL